MLKRDEIVILLLLFVLFPTLDFSQDSGLDPVTSKYALKNVTIVQAPGRVIENGTVVIENGLIKSVGSSVTVPADAWVVPADSMYVYAGFISGPSNIGVAKPKEENKSDDRKLTGKPSYQRAGITPNTSVRTMLNPKEKSIAEYRKLGFTAAHAVPHNGMIPGTGSIILLGGSTNESMVLKENTSMFSQWQGAGGVYPNTVIGIMAKYRDLYRKANQARTYGTKYNTASNGMERPVADQVLEAMYPVVAKQLPVVFKTENLLDITRALTLKNDLGFNLVLTEVKQGWDLTSQIKQSGAPVFLSLDLPEMKEEKKEEKKEDDETNEGNEEDEKPEPTSEEIEKEALEKRKAEMIKNYYTQPSKFVSQGIRYGFSTQESKAKDFKGYIRKIIQNGLSEDQALAALTTNPAMILGVSSTMGTVENGKMANLIVTDKPYFDEKSNVRYVFVDGVKYDFEVKEKKKKKSNGDAPVDMSGKWSFTYESPDGSQSWSGKLDLKKANDSYEGTAFLSFNDSTNEITEVDIDGSSVTIGFTVNAFNQDTKITIAIEVEDDAFEGTFTAGNFGSFEMEGEKDPQY